MEQHVIVVIVSVCSVVISTAIITGSKKLCSKNKEKVENLEDMDKKMNDLDGKIDRIAEALAEITEKIKILGPVKDGQLGTLKYRLSRMYQKYKCCGEITQYELDEFLDLYEPFKALDDGDNDSVYGMVKYVKSLPIVKEHKEKTK
jgi:hypothetical protein